jgi:carboxyl-terminal processing protease
MALTVADSARSTDTPATPLPPFGKGAEAFEALKSALLARYPGGGTTEDDLYRAAAQGMLEHVDEKRGAWNKLLSPDDMRAMKEDLEGEVVGIGAEIDFDPSTGYAEVLSVLAGSPAERAGLARRDTIVDVDGHVFQGQTRRDLLDRLHGKAGETVNVSVLRANRLLTVPVVRAKVDYPVVVHELLAPRVGYLRIKSFNAMTPPAVESALSDLAGADARALVVDLRGNPGGAFDDAIEVAEQLLPAGASVVREVKKGEPDKTLRALKGAKVLASVPVVVVINHETASSAEFLTAALHDARKARVLGQTTFGKWSVQTLEDLPNGYGVKYTVGMLETGSGVSYDGIGFPPDLEVDLDAKGLASAERQPTVTARLGVDVQLRTAVALTDMVLPSPP